MNRNAKILTMKNLSLCLAVLLLGLYINVASLAIPASSACTTLDGYGNINGSSSDTARFPHALCDVAPASYWSSRIIDARKVSVAAADAAVASKKLKAYEDAHGYTWNIVETAKKKWSLLHNITSALTGEQVAVGEGAKFHEPPHKVFEIPRKLFETLGKRGDKDICDKPDFEDAGSGPLQSANDIGRRDDAPGGRNSLWDKVRSALSFALSSGNIIPKRQNDVPTSTSSDSNDTNLTLVSLPTTADQRQDDPSPSETPLLTAGGKFIQYPDGEPVYPHKEESVPLWAGAPDMLVVFILVVLILPIIIGVALYRWYKKEP